MSLISFAKYSPTTAEILERKPAFEPKSKGLPHDIGATRPPMAYKGFDSSGRSPKPEPPKPELISEPPPPPEKPAEEPPEDQKQGYVKTVVAFIPSEAVGLYVFGAGLFQSGSETNMLSPSIGKAIVFWTVLILTPAYVWYVTYNEFKKKKKKPRRSKLRKELAWKMSMSTFAFVVWAAAMPGSIFAGYVWYDARLAAFLLALTALVLPKLTDMMLSEQTPAQAG